MKKGTELIAEERKRQIEEEGWTSEHDDKHYDSEMADAAVCYALDGRRVIHWNTSKVKAIATIKLDRNLLWPWDETWWKPEAKSLTESGAPYGVEGWVKGRIKDLTKSGALIAAEIDRLQRMLESNATDEKVQG